MASCGCYRFSPVFSRRDMLRQSAVGFGWLAADDLLSKQRPAAAAPAGPTSGGTHSLQTRASQFSPRAKRVIFLFMHGGPSQVDTFDYKQDLIRYHGKPLPGNERLVSFQGPHGNLTHPLWKFRARGQCGKMVSDLVPHIGSMVDEICFLHSLTNKSNTHGPAENVLNTGFAFDGFPSMGAWINYALGTENQNLPAFVAIEAPRGLPQSGPNLSLIHI